MTLSFSKYIQLNEGSSDYGIAHLEDLDVETFIRAVENISKLEAVQKLDGANLRAGLDEDGDLYASREQKGGKRFYKQKDFPKSSAYDGFKTAFEVLKQHEDIVKSVLSPGETMNLEVIYGAQPNTVFYGKDGINYLAILEMVVGDDPSIEPDQSKVKELVKQFKALGTIHVQTVVHDTVDGVNIAKAPTTTDWQITSSDVVEGYENLDFSDELSSLKKFLRQDNKLANKIGKDLTNFEVLKDRGKDLSEERKSIEQKIYNDYKLPIKKQLLKLVAKQKPSLRGEIDDDGAYKGIEGIIFTNPKTREKFKVVDRDVFTKINKFNYEVRKSVASRPLTTDQDAPKEKRGGVVGEARLRSINLFGLGNADSPNQTKKVLANFKGSTEKETIDNIADTLHQLDFQAARKKIQAIYVTSLDDLDEALETFKKNADSYSLKLDDGTEIKYTKEIRRRTLMSFAEARKTIIEMIVKIRKTESIEDLLLVFFDKQIKDLHSGDVNAEE